MKAAERTSSNSTVHCSVSSDTVTAVTPARRDSDVSSAATQEAQLMPLTANTAVDRSSAMYTADLGGGSGGWHGPAGVRQREDQP